MAATVFCLELWTRNLRKERSATSREGRFYFISQAILFDWSRKLAPSSQPIRLKTKTNRNASWSHALSRATRSVLVFVLIFP